MGAFVLLAVVWEPVRRSLAERLTRISHLLEGRIEVRGLARVTAVLAVVIGLFDFGFWATADVLGGYNGYGWSLAEHPYLREIYAANFLRFVPWDAGTQATLFFSLAALGFAALGAGRGIGTALKDSITLFAAPILVAFEFALWSSAPEDMTWHVIDALWAGGVNNLGWRAFDGARAGAFLFSNWLVLLVAILLLASRVPFLGVPSGIVHRRLATYHGSLRWRKLLGGVSRKR